MEARTVEDIPEGDEWAYEPKWDGFRCLAFRDGQTIQMQSKSGQPLERYFPELVEARWYQFALHSYTAARLRRALLHKGGPQVVVLSAPWHLRETRRERRLARRRRTAPG